MIFRIILTQTSVRIAFARSQFSLLFLAATIPTLSTFCLRRRMTVSCILLRLVCLTDSLLFNPRCILFMLFALLFYLFVTLLIDLQ